MPTNEYATLKESGLFNTDRGGFRAVNGIGRIALENQRHRCLALRDDPNLRDYELTWGGVQKSPPKSDGTGRMVLTPGTSGGTMTTDKTYYICYTFYSSRYKRESDPSITQSVALVSPQTEIAVTFGSSDADFLAPVENGDVPDAVDRVRFYRTTATQTDVASTTPGTSIGTWYRCLEVPLHSFMPYTDWLTATAYTVGTTIKTTVSGFLRRYRCVVPHTSGTFATDNTNGYWFLLGQSAALIRLPDADIAYPARRLINDRGLPPGMWSAAFHQGRLYLTGRQPRIVTASLTNGSRVMNVSSTAVQGRDRFYDGDVSMEAVVDDPGSGLNASSIPTETQGDKYFIDAWLSASQVYLDRAFEGQTNVSRNVTLRDTAPGAIRYSNVVGPGLTGAPAPDEFPADNVVYYKPDDGLGNEALIEGRGVVYVIKRNSIGAFRNAGDQPEEIEQRTVLTRGDRNLAKGVNGEWFGVSHNGIFIFEEPGPSRIISDAVRDLWEPDFSTTYSWNISQLDRAVLTYHPSLNWLIMIGPEAGQTGNALGLIWDQRADAWCVFKMFCDPAGTTVAPDITYAVNVNINGREEVLLCGRLGAASVAGSVEIDTEHVGRMWLVESGFRDNLPGDKISARLDHRILWRRAFTPVLGDTGQRVEIVRIVTHMEPNPIGDVNGFGMTLRVQTDKGREQTLTEVHRGSLRNFHETFTFGSNPSRRVTPVIYGTMGGPDGEMKGFEELILEPRFRGKGTKD